MLNINYLFKYMLYKGDKNLLRINNMSSNYFKPT